MLSLSVVSDQISPSFCDHNRRCVRVPANNGRHDGSIDDAQTFDPMDAELVIDHREIIIAHFTAASEMVNASGILTYILLSLWAWEPGRASTSVKCANDVVWLSRRASFIPLMSFC